MANQNLNITIKAFDQTKKAFSGVTKSIRKVAKAVFSMKTAIAAVAGLTGIGLLVRQSLKATDVLAKTATKIGTTTEALSKMRYAADLTGVSTETMDMALQRFVRRTAEAARGTGEAKGALRELNLDAAKLIQMPLDQQLIELANAFESVGTDADKVRLAMKLFDSEGVSLVNTLGAGRDELIAMFNEAEKLGIVMSGKSAAGVEKANDALTRLFSLFKGVRDQIVAALAPAIEKLVTIIKEKLLKQLEAVNGDFSKLSILIRDKLLGFISSLIYGFANAALGIENFGNKIIEVFNKADKFFGGEGDITKFTGELSTSLFNAGDAIKQFGENLKLVGNTANTLTKTTLPIRTLADDIKDAIDTATDAIPSLQESLTSVANTFANSFTQSITDAIVGTKSFSDAMKNMARSVINSLAKMMVQYYITKPLMEAVGGALGIPNPSGKAIGGSVQAGQPYMVGERGAEMFVPNQSGSIVPNNKLGGGQGVVVNQTINVTTGVQQTVRAEIQNLMPQISKATKSAVADARARGGSYSKALLGV